MCSECQEVGHTRKRCPTAKCRVCNELGHMSFDYDKKEYPPENNTETENNEEEKREDQLSEEEPEETTEQFHKRNWAFPNEQEFS